MHTCPTCGSLEGFCEEVDLTRGEVLGYHCIQCGYDEELEEESERIASFIQAI